jgi:hypothetical protein
MQFGVRPFTIDDDVQEDESVFIDTSYSMKSYIITKHETSQSSVDIKHHWPARYYNNSTKRITVYEAYTFTRSSNPKGERAKATPHKQEQHRKTYEETKGSQKREGGRNKDTSTGMGNVCRKTRKNQRQLSTKHPLGYCMRDENEMR